MSRIPISFIVPVYNEAARIRFVLEHATRWADEVVIADKGSTDGTLDICRNYGDKVRIESLPYTLPGNEDVTLFPGYCRYEWIFGGTCSEVPTRRLIETCRSVLDSTGNSLDLVLVPRRMYSFGLHCSNPKWGVCYYPFLFHRTRTRIVNDVHDNFHADDPARVYRIPYSEDCCVYHLTHPTAKAFWLSSLHYFEAELQKPTSHEKAIRQCFKNIDRMAQKVLQDNENWVPFYCAFASYELGKALHVWERSRGKETAFHLYDNLRQHLLTREWNCPNTAEIPALPETPKINVPDARPMAAFLARLPYELFKLMSLFRRR